MKIKHANISYAKKKLRKNFPIYGIWLGPELHMLSTVYLKNVYANALWIFHAINFTATITNNLPDTTRLPLHPFTGPSAPRDVTVCLITPRLVEVKWRAPALSNGQIIRYTVYAIPIAVSGPAISKRQAASNLPSGTIKQVCLYMWLYA